MTQEERELVLKEICARIYYWPNIITDDGDVGHIYGVDNTNEGVFNIHILEDVDDYDTELSVEHFKLLLRPMDSMDEKEKVMFFALNHNPNTGVDYIVKAPALMEWLHEKGFDYNGLIEKGLAKEKRQDWLR